MFIAEIGLNHKGDEQAAFRFVQKLVQTQAEAITFQIPNPEFYEKVKDWGDPLPNTFYKKAIDFVHKHHKLIGFAVGDKKIIPFLDQSGADFWKSLSIYINDKDVMGALQNTGKTIFVSTGVSDEQEIVRKSKELGNLKLIHTQLSQKLSDTNLKAISRLRELTGIDVAFGLHCSDHTVLSLSLAFSPSDFFFYVKENLHEKYPDDKHALLMDEVDATIQRLNELREALGSGIKKKMESRLE